MIWRMPSLIENIFDIFFLRLFPRFSHLLTCVNFASFLYFVVLLVWIVPFKVSIFIPPKELNLDISGFFLDFPNFPFFSFLVLAMKACDC